MTSSRWIQAVVAALGWSGCSDGTGHPGLVGEEHLLAVRTHEEVAPDGLLLGTQVTILRHVDGGWLAGPEPFVATREVSVAGTTFSAERIAWAFGFVGDLNENPSPGLVRSGDAGETWVDVSATIALGPNRQIASLTFSDLEHGWLIAPNVRTNPTVGPPADRLQITTDGGSSFVPGGSCGAVRLCAGEAFCLASGARIGPATGAEDYCEPGADDPRSPPRPPLVRLDMRRDGRGIACWTPNELPECSFTDDAGTIWSQSSLPASLGDEHLTTVTSVILTADGGAWATVAGRDPNDGKATTRFLRSTDGGASWQTAGDLVRGAILNGLSRSSVVVDRGFALE